MKKNSMGLIMTTLSAIALICLATAKASIPYMMEVSMAILGLMIAIGIVGGRE